MDTAYPFTNELALDEERSLFDAIVRLQFSGEHIGHPSTKKYIRQGHLLPDLFPR